MKKNDRQFYLPGGNQETIILATFSFFTIEDKGKPIDEFFADYM